MWIDSSTVTTGLVRPTFLIVTISILNSLRIPVGSLATTDHQSVIAKYNNKHLQL